MTFADTGASRRRYAAFPVLRHDWTPAKSPLCSICRSRIDVSGGRPSIARISIRPTVQISTIAVDRDRRLPGRLHLLSAEREL